MDKKTTLNQPKEVPYDLSPEGLRPTFDQDKESAQNYYKSYLDFLDQFVDRKSKILDIGCGEGWSTYFLRKRGHDAIGLDVPKGPPAVSIIDPDFPYHSGDARKLPFKDGFFDAIGIYQTIAHIPEPQAVFEECLRVLRPGGRLIVVGPNLISFLYNIRWLIPIALQELRGQPLLDRRKYPGGSTLKERVYFSGLFFYQTIKKLVHENPVKFWTRKPCTEEPFHGNNDASYFSNPMDILNWAKQTQEMKAIRWWKDGYRWVWPFTVGTWVVVQKNSK